MCSGVEGHFLATFIQIKLDPLGSLQVLARAFIVHRGRAVEKGRQMENTNIKIEEPAQSLLDLEDLESLNFMISSEAGEEQGWEGIQNALFDPVEAGPFEYKQTTTEDERVASPISTSSTVSTDTADHGIACVPNWMTNYLQLDAAPMAGDVMPELDSTKAPALELEVNTAITNVTDSEFNDENLKEISVKELNRMVKQKGLSKQEVAKIKYQRRTIKNRGYAQNCRIKRIKQKQTLQEENVALHKQVEALQSQLESVTKERDEMKTKYKQIKKFVFVTCANQKIIAS